MTDKIRIGIVGYGNIGRGCELAVQSNEDMELEAIFTRRAPQSVHSQFGTKVLHVDDAPSMQGKIDVAILCSGSATDLPEQGPQFAKLFHTVDSFDTHPKIPQYFAAMDAAARQSGHLSIISVGWDPGLFSLNRVYAQAILPNSDTYTFWGRGVSQGHSDAIRRVPGVKNAIQYTVPVEQALEAVRSGSRPKLTTRQKHTRECYVVAQPGADKKEIERRIKEMPDYFADYDTTVTFMEEPEFLAAHNKMPHGGFVMCSGVTGGENRQLIEFSLKLDSNPQFTAQILAAYARAAFRLAGQGQKGALSVLDVAPSLISPFTPEQLREKLL